MNFQEIKQLIKVIEKSNVGEVEIVEDTFKIRISKNSSYSVVQQAVPAATPPAASLMESMPTPTIEAPVATTVPAAPEEKPAEQFGDNVVEVNSPMVGTFYRAPAPDADPYVQVGDTVRVGQTLCIIEAMKLMNEIQSEVNGKVVKIMVENAQPVEYDQVLFLIEKE